MKWRNIENQCMKAMAAKWRGGCHQAAAGGIKKNIKLAYVASYSAAQYGVGGVTERKLAKKA
jgi:hypothetical protein